MLLIVLIIVPLFAGILFFKEKHQESGNKELLLATSQIFCFIKQVFHKSFILLILEWLPWEEAVATIKSKKDYEFFLEADKFALRIRKPQDKQEYFAYHFWNEIWKFEKLLRKTEYYQNCAKSFAAKAYFFYLRNRLHKQQIKLGLNIPPNCFGPGLSIAHCGPIIVNPAARIGSNCRIHIDVVIAGKTGFENKAPVIGDNVYIGAGAKIFGDIVVANDVAIGTNSVVNKSFTDPNVTIAGVPARVVSHKGSRGLLVKGTEMARLHIE